MRLVAGVDSSTQGCKVLVCDGDTGVVVRHGKAPHPAGSEIDPEHWWRALGEAVRAAGGLDDVSAISVAAQQHGLICLDEHGRIVRPALLWNDTRSAEAAGDLVTELGAAAWVDAIGSVPVASFTITKLRWLAEHEPASLARTVAVGLPHDWLTWRLLGHRDPHRLVTDRGDASGSGWWSPAAETQRDDLVRLAAGRPLDVPVVLAPDGVAGDAVTLAPGAVVGAGTGDNMAAALGLGAVVGDAVVSVGTSGVATAVSERAAADPTGIVAGFADATGRFLPLVCTLNAAQTIDATATMLGVDHDGFDALAMAAPLGAAGVTMLPYLTGERTPNLPRATGSFHGLRLDNLTAANIARAAVEAVLCGLRLGLDALQAHGAPLHRILLTGGGSRSHAVRAIAPAVLGHDVVVPADAEHVALGAARQAAWVLDGVAPAWTIDVAERCRADPARQAASEALFERHRRLSERYAVDLGDPGP